jgi:hypothetical protein
MSSGALISDAKMRRAFGIASISAAFMALFRFRSFSLVRLRSFASNTTPVCASFFP